MKQWLYRWLPIIFGCHCRDDRSFYYHGEKFPICARCTGELVGMIAGLFSCFFFRPPFYAVLLLLLPLIADGVLQMATAYESNNRRRLWTGILFGYGLVLFVVITTIAVFHWGHNLGMTLIK